MKLILPVLILSSSLWAQSPNYCEVKGQKPNKVIKIDKSPDYFFKASADGKKIYYISARSNYVLDTESLSEGNMPGIADPVPSPDGKLFSYLEPGWKLFLGVMENNKDISSVYTDNETRPYQSIGQSNDKYRLFSQLGTENYIRWSYSDYTIVDGKIEVVKRSTDVPKSAHLRLPMLDKSGKYLIAQNSNTNRSEVISVETGAVIDTLPVGGGKSDFSFDGKKIAFHLTVNPSYDVKKNEEEFASIMRQEGVIRNIFVYDRPSKKLKQVTNFTSGSAFFPVFLKNGQIVYLYKTPEGSYEFHIVNEPGDSLRSKVVVENCLGVEVTDSAMSVLINKWLETCNNWTGQADRTMAELAVLNLPKAYCLSLGKTANVSKQIMEKFCDPKIKTIEPANKTNNEKVLSKTILNNKCVTCHNDIPFHDEKKLGKWKNKIDARINSRDPSFRMPRGDSLSALEKETLSKYIRQF